MKTVKSYLTGASKPVGRLVAFLMLGSSLLILDFPAGAEIPAPDNILYGTITLGSQPVTSAQTNVIVEARKTLTDPPVRTYRMGSEPGAGNFYLLKVPLEELAPVVNTASSTIGNTLFVVVRDPSGPRATNTFQISERGTVTRLDIGTPGDSDGDGLPDGWELARFGTLSHNGSSLGANGLTLNQNYVAGTDPNNPNDRFALAITAAGPNQFISFLARQASGPGYEGRTRYYSIEYTTNLGSGQWIGAPNQTNLLGNNTTRTYQATEGGSPVVYRGQVRLQTP